MFHKRDSHEASSLHDHPHEHGNHSHIHGVIDPSITTSRRGIWVIKWSLVGV